MGSPLPAQNLAGMKTLHSKTPKLHIKTVLVCVACSCFTGLGSAATFGLHLGSRHDEAGFNDRNLGIYAKFDNGLTLGTFENSVSRQSFYVGKTWEIPVAEQLDAAVTAGAITGYDRDISPLLVPSLAFEVAPGIKLRGAVLFKVNKTGANAFHLMLEKEFN